MSNVFGSTISNLKALDFFSEETPPENTSEIHLVLREIINGRRSEIIRHYHSKSKVKELIKDS